MNFKKIILFCFILKISIIEASNTIFDNKNISYALGTLAAGCGIWAIKERVTKNRLQEELNGTNLVADAGIHIKSMQQDYTNFLKNKAPYDAKDFFDCNRNIFKTKIEFDNFCKSLNQDINKNLMYFEKLEFLKLKIANDIKYENELIHINKNIIPNLKNIDCQIKEIKKVCDENCNFYILKIALINYSRKYFKEIKTFEINKNKDKKIINSIHKHVVNTYIQPPYKFPYITYVENLNQDIKNLQKLIDNAQIEKTLNICPQVNQQAQYFLNLFELLLDQFVNSTKYLKEIEDKLDSERKQEKIKNELKERESLIVLEKQKNEVALQKEKNRNLQLETVAKETERSINELLERQEIIALETARIAEGKNIKIALEKQAIEWQEKYNDILKSKNSLENYIEKTKALVAILKLKLNNLPDKNKPELLAQYFKDITENVNNLATQ